MNASHAITDYFAVFNNHQYMNLTTFRKSGEGVTTPVWFAQDGYRLFVRTFSIAWKTKRIRNNPRVQVGPCNMSGKSLGLSVEARARILSGDEGKVADKLLSAKYGLMYKVARLRARNSNSVFIEITAPDADG